MAKKGQKFKNYEDAFINEVVIFSNQHSIRQAAAHYGVAVGTVNT